MPAFDEQDYTKSFQWGIWKRLMPVMRPYRRDFAGMFAFNLITAAIDVVLPLFQRYAISNYIEAGTLSGLLPYTLCYFGVILLQALSVVAFARNSMKIEMCAGRDMRANLFTHLQTLSFSFYNVTPVGYLLSRVMSDTSRIASMVAWNLTDILWAMFYVLGTFAAMLLLNWKLALVVIVIVPVIAVLTGYFQNRILHWNRRVRKLNSRITGAFNEGITGAKTSKTLGIEEQNTASFRALTKEMHDCGIRAARLNAVYIPLVLFCSTAAVAIVLLREFAVSGMRLVAVEQGRVIAAAWSGKVKTASTMVCLCAMLLNVFGAYAWFDPLCNAVIVLTTAYSGIEYFIKNADVFREPD